jgi:hypothetical protein
MKPKLILLALCLGLCALPPAALPLAAAEITTSWPATRAGELAKGWVTAFNGGEAAMRGFLAANMAAHALGERAVPVRIARYQELREEYGRLRLDAVTRSEPLEITARLLDADAKPREFVFKTEDRAPFKLRSVSLKQTGFSHGFGFGHGH